jgi:hypothetical protein
VFASPPQERFSKRIQELAAQISSREQLLEQGGELMG